MNGKKLHELQNELHKAAEAIERIFKAGFNQDLLTQAISKYNEIMVRVAELNEQIYEDQRAGKYH